MKFIVYRLEYKDGAIDVKLSYVQRAYLYYLDDHGGELRFDYLKISEEQRRHLGELVRLGCLLVLPIIGERPSLVTHRLTDGGRNIVAAIRKAGGP